MSGYVGLYESREALIRAIIERDGEGCSFPGCVREGFDEDGPYELTIDHHYPVSYGRANGWTHEEIWALSNCTIQHKVCNSRKGDRVPNPDGTLPPTAEELRPLHQRRADKSSRVPVCETCMSGRLLLHGEVCYDCGSGPQPSTLPKYLQVSPKECSHGWGERPEVHCWRCFLGFEKRRPAIESVMDADGMK